MTLAHRSEPRLRLRLLPLVVVMALAVGIPFLAATATILVLHRQPDMHDPDPQWLYLHHGFQLVLALLAIAVLKRWVPADYGLHLPRRQSYLLPAVLWGALFGVVMILVDHAPELLARTRPTLSYPLTRANVANRLFFECVYVGPTEEIPFRSLLVSYLATTLPGKVRLGRFEMNWAGVIVALLFALLHASNFFARPWPLALGQQLYAFVLGVLYAYWLEKSGSVMASSIGHNLSDGVEYLLLFAWVAA